MNWKRIGLVLATPLIALAAMAQGAKEARLGYINLGAGWVPWDAIEIGGLAPGYPLQSILLYCQSGSTTAPCNPAAPSSAMTVPPPFTISKTFTVRPQTVRAIVGQIAGLSTTNGGTFMDIYPLGYNQWAAGITFEDYATPFNGTNNSGGAINLGLADDNGDSQGICFISTRAVGGDTKFCLDSAGGALTWNNSFGDAMALGLLVRNSFLSVGYATRFGWDATNAMAVMSGGGAQQGSGVGAALAVNGGTSGLSSTYALICDAAANCGIGPQKKTATSDPFWVSPAGAATAVSYTTTGLPTGCAQYPCVVYHNLQTGLTAATGVTTVFTPAADGSYQLLCSQWVTTAGTAGTMQCGYTWSAPGGAGAGTGASTSQAMTAVGNTTQITMNIRAVAAGPIRVFSNYTAATGAPVYSLDQTIVRLN